MSEHAENCNFNRIRANEKTECNCYEGQKARALKAEAEASELRTAVAWAYQMAGANDAPVWALDNLSDLANRSKRRHEWQPAEDYRYEALKERDSLKARLEAAERVIAASRCIRHWHDTAQGGMIVSQEKVFELWAALEQYDATMSEKEPKA